MLEELPSCVQQLACTEVSLRVDSVMRFGVERRVWQRQRQSLLCQRESQNIGQVFSFRENGAVPGHNNRRNCTQQDSQNRR
jgi:hypothetical protein